MRYVIDKFVSYFSVDEQAIAAGYTDCDILELNFINGKYLFPYLTFIKENRRVFSAVLSQPVAFRLESVFERLFDNVFNPILDRFRYPQGERKYVMMFYLNGLTAIITEWLKDGCEKSTEEVAEIIRYCIFGRTDTWNIATPHNK